MVLLISQNNYAWSGSLFDPKRMILVSISLLFLTSVPLAQFKPPPSARAPLDHPITAGGEASDLAIRSIEALQRLERLVPVYRSRGTFEANTKLSSVPFEVFKKESERVCLSQISSFRNPVDGFSRRLLAPFQELSQYQRLIVLFVSSAVD